MIGRHFIIKIDHQSLKFLLEQKITITLRQKGYVKLLGLDFSILYKKGSENGAADALSRKIEKEKPYFNTIIATTPKWIKEIGETYKNDTWDEEHLLTTTLIDPAR